MKYLGIEPGTGAELGRFVCLDAVAYNGETWFLARAFRLLRSERPGIRGVVSYADPLERRAGELLVKGQHWGTIYQASSATYVGRSDTRTLVIAPDGSIVSPRALSKIRTRERGWRYAEAQLLAWGAAPRGFGEAPAAWVTRALASPVFRRVRHPGNLAYVFALDDAARASVRTLHGAGLPYEKRRTA